MTTKNQTRNVQFTLHDRNKGVIQQSIKDHAGLLGPSVAAIALQEVEEFHDYGGAIKLNIKRSGTAHSTRLIIDLETSGNLAGPEDAPRRKAK